MNRNEIIRKSDRNVSLKVKNGEKYLFVKQSASGKTCPAEEYYVWKRLRAVDQNMIPECFWYNLDTGEIAYEWLENFEQIKNGYNVDNLRLIVNFLDRNAQFNKYEMLKNDSQLLAVLKKRKEKQINYFKNVLLNNLLTVTSNLNRNTEECISQLIQPIKILQKNECLCHGDLGRSNILIHKQTQRIRIVDYEYSMISSKEIDYARIIVSMILQRDEGSITSHAFIECCEIVLDGNQINYTALSLLMGLQLFMRIKSNCKVNLNRRHVLDMAIKLLFTDSETKSSLFCKLGQFICK